jgi:hypothetical protein
MSELLISFVPKKGLKFEVLGPASPRGCRLSI